MKTRFRKYYGTTKFEKQVIFISKASSINLFTITNKFACHHEITWVNKLKKVQMQTKIVFNFMQFLGKSSKFVCWRPPPPLPPKKCWCPLLREILDPPLLIDIHIPYSLLKPYPLLPSVNGGLNVIKDKIKK